MQYINDFICCLFEKADFHEYAIAILISSNVIITYCFGETCLHFSEFLNEKNT